ncbi:MAG: lipopolysaccharide transport periplasmic protein LptA [Rhodoferax sp.]|nr:lipopolysaccharide transport periplasmic protein LptA [Rhodoferax sp.]
MKIPFCRCAVSLLLCLTVAAAQAEKADRDKPMNVEADALRYDDAKQISVFSGRVVLTKGTIVMRGAKVEVRQDPAGNQFGIVTAEAGKLAFFRQKREGLDEFIEGEGQTIHYDGHADTVKLVGNAQLRRYLGSQLNDEFKASVIVYNNTTEVFTLDGAPVAGGVASPATGLASGRVRAMLTPRQGGAAAPSVAASKPALPLRETPQLRATKP